MSQDWCIPYNFFRTVLNKIRKIHLYKSDAVEERGRFSIELRWMMLHPTRIQQVLQDRKTLLTGGKRNPRIVPPRIHTSALSASQRSRRRYRRTFAAGSTEPPEVVADSRIASAPRCSPSSHSTHPQRTSLSTAPSLNFYHSGPRSL